MNFYLNYHDFFSYFYIITQKKASLNENNCLVLSTHLNANDYLVRNAVLIIRN